MEIYRALNSQHARMLQHSLEECGIRSFVAGEETAGALGLQGFAWEGSPRVYVADADAPEARQIAVEFDQDLNAPEIEDDDYASGESKPWTDWPECPTCRIRRVAVCPDCEANGDDFAVAEFVVDYKGTLLACPNCDQNFPPQFVRECANCGHDFGSGVKLVVYEPHVVNHRALLVLILLTALGIAAACFLWTLTH